MHQPSDCYQFHYFCKWNGICPKMINIRVCKAAYSGKPKAGAIPVVCLQENGTYSATKRNGLLKHTATGGGGGGVETKTHLAEGKEILHQRVLRTWLYLYEVPEWVKIIDGGKRNQKSRCRFWTDNWALAGKGQESIPGEGNILYLDLLLGYIGAHFRPNLQHFIVYEVHIKKTNYKQVWNSS